MGFPKACLYKKCCTSSGVNGFFQGYYDDEAALNTALPVGELGWYVILGDTNTVWLRDGDTNTWVDSGNAGTSLALQTNSVSNSDQSLLNLIAGDNIQLSNTGGNVTITNPLLQINNSTLVATNGNDGTGQINRWDKPFATIQAAINTAGSNNIVSFGQQGDIDVNKNILLVCYGGLGHVTFSTNSRASVICHGTDSLVDGISKTGTGNYYIKANRFRFGYPQSQSSASTPPARSYGVITNFSNGGSIIVEGGQASPYGATTGGAPGNNWQTVNAFYIDRVDAPNSKCLIKNMIIGIQGVQFNRGFGFLCQSNLIFDGCSITDNAVGGLGIDWATMNRKNGLDGINATLGIGKVLFKDTLYKGKMVIDGSNNTQIFFKNFTYEEGVAILGIFEGYGPAGLDFALISLGGNSATSYTASDPSMAIQGDPFLMTAGYPTPPLWEYGNTLI